jgi:hypothetical protein
MPPARRPTPELEQTIAAYIRAGGYPQVAAEAAGVPGGLFDDWMRRGDSRRGAADCRRFAEAVRQAHAQARLKAEVAALKDRPLDWLRSGPGKEAAARPGWTGTVKPRPAAGPEPPSPLLDHALQRLFRACLDALAPFPDAHAAVAQALPDLAPPPDSG